MNFVSGKLKTIANLISQRLKRLRILSAGWQKKSFINRTLKKMMNFINWLVVNAINYKCIYVELMQVGLLLYVCGFACNSNADYKTIINVYLVLYYRLFVLNLCGWYFTFTSLKNFNF